MTHFASACCTSFSGATIHLLRSAATSVRCDSLPNTSIAHRSDWGLSTCASISDTAAGEKARAQHR